MKKIGTVYYGATVPKPGTADRIHFVNVDQKACIGCKNCNAVCPTGAITSTKPSDRWAPSHIPDPEMCIYCGQCLVNCPVHAIYEEISFIEPVWKAIADPGIITVAMPAPAIRYALGEEFGLTEGTYVGPKMFAALRALGFDYVWDIEFGADVTILEEGTELLGRVSNGGAATASGAAGAHGAGEAKPLPQFTSCCPGWIKYVETFFPELIPHLSSTKSPTQIMGPLAKTYGAENIGADPARMYTVAIMPCVAKKFEGLREEFQVSGFRDIDATIDTRELAQMIRDAGIDFAGLNPSEAEGKADDLLGMSTGAATIFGVTGGVMEAMLRLLVEKLDGRTLDRVEFAAVRGQKGIREATVTAGGKEVKVAIVNGLGNERKICEDVRDGTSPYVAVEIMTCPGGCINGGGQPYAAWNSRDVGVTPSLLNLRRMVQQFEERLG